ncbi:MAG: hypothetical protein WC657_06190 [Candidatus Paceibacterota bacterium]|jgi:hypothetical protein
MNKRFPKPIKVLEIPVSVIDGEVWGMEVSILSDAERDYIKLHPDHIPGNAYPDHQLKETPQK